MIAMSAPYQCTRFYYMAVGLPLNSKSRKNNNTLRLCTALDVPPAKYLLEKYHKIQASHFISYLGLSLPSLC